MSSKDISYLILRIQFLFYYFLSIQGFSLESKEEIFLVPSENSKLKIGFGESFIIKKQGNYTKFVVGAPKSFSDSGVLRRADAKPLGEVISCGFSLDSIQGNRLVCTNQPSYLRSSQPSDGIALGQIVDKLNNENIISCSPSSEVECTNVIFTPGSCYESSNGKSWRSMLPKPGCPPDRLDLMFVLDGSTSVKKSGFKKVKKWTKLLSEQFFENVNKIKTNLGVIQYSTFFSTYVHQPNIKTEIELGKFKSFEKFKKAVSNIKFMGGSTYTAEALNKTLKDFEASDSLESTSTARVIILLTDGRSSRPRSLPKISEKIRSLNITIFAVGVGNEINEKELKMITSGSDSNEKVFLVDDFDALDQIVESLKKMVYTVALEGGTTQNISKRLESAQIGFSLNTNQQVCFIFYIWFVVWLFV